MKRTILSIVLLGILLHLSIGCSSVQEGNPAPVRTVRLPRFFMSEISSGDVNIKSDDFRVRQKPSAHHRLMWVRLPSALENVSDSLQELFLIRVRHLIAAGGYEVLDDVSNHETVQWKDADHYTKENREKLSSLDLDALLLISYSNGSSDGKYYLNMTLADPFDGRTLSEYSVPLIVVKPPSMENRDEFFLGRGGYRFLDGKNSSRIVGERFTETSLNDFLKKSHTTTLRLASSSPDSRFYLYDYRGKTDRPISPPADLELNEGEYKLVIKRKGNADIVKNLLMRAGREQNLFITYPDDPDQTSLSLYTSPSGLRVAFDGSVRGDTPYFQTGIRPGIYSLEIARTDEDGIYYVTAEHDLDLFEGRNNDVAHMIRYETKFGEDIYSEGLWKLIYSEEGTRGRVVSEKDSNSGIKAVMKNPASLVGLSSHVIPLTHLQSFTASLDIPRSYGGYLMFGILKRDGHEKGNGYFLEKQNGLFQAVSYMAGEPNAPDVSYTLKPDEEKKLTSLCIVYDAEDHVLRWELNGDSIMKMENITLGDGRLVILTDGESAQGKSMLGSLRVESEPYVGDEESNDS